MALPDDPMAQVTRLPNLAFVDENNNRYRALNTPILSQAEVIDIPVTENLTGAIVFNRDTEELETYTAAGFWLPILTSESDINAHSITALNADLTHIHSHDITNDAGITTLDLQSASINNSDVITTLGLHVTSNVQIDGNMLCATGGVTGSLGVNGSLTAGNLATTGTLLVDGDSTLQDVTINGNLTVNGLGIFQNLNATNIGALDIGADSIQAEQLLYGLTNLGGSAPINVTLSTGAGTGATYSITGSDLGGIFTLNTGSSPTGSAIIATFSFDSDLNPLMNGHASMITKAANQVTATYEAANGTFINSTTSNIFASMGSNTTPLTASTTYIWNYIIVGNQLGT